MIRKIKKRDGRIVPFDQEKIAGSIARAGRMVGRGDDLLSEELASVVTLFIEKTFGEDLPNVQDVRDVVERVLMETGHTDTARLFILHSERRLKQIEALRIMDVDGKKQGETFPDNNSADGAGSGDNAGTAENGGSGENPGLAGGDVSREFLLPDLEVDSTTHASIYPWSKARIVSDLVGEAGVPPAMASEIASQVEERVVRSGIVRISTSLIRELVDNELFNRGFNGRTFAGMRVGIPALEVKALVESDGGGRTPTDVAGSVTESVMRQFSLRDLYAPDEVEVHLRGEAVQEGLALPSGYLGASLDPVRLPEPLGSLERPPAYLGAVVRFLERFLSGNLTIDISDLSLDRHCRMGEDGGEWARDMVVNLACGPAGIPGPRNGIVLRLRRTPSPAGRMIFENTGVRLKSIDTVIDETISQFIDALTEAGRELTLPVMQIDLFGDGPMDGETMERAVVLEAAGRVKLSVSGFEREALAAIEPLQSGARIDLERILEGAEDRGGARFFANLKSVLAMTAAAFASKNRFLAKLHRAGRGPKAALRRFLGGDGSVVGAGSFRVVPCRVGRAALSAVGLRPGRDEAEIFVADVLRFMRDVLTEEERRLGIRILLSPPWSSPEKEFSDLFDGSPGIAAGVTARCALYTGYDPLPDFFVGDAGIRLEYLKAILKKRSEPDYAA
jgi:hypothetical protein